MFSPLRTLNHHLHGREFTNNSKVVYNAAISCCDRGEQWEHALAVLTRLGLRMKPDIISLSSLEVVGVLQFSQKQPPNLVPYSMPGCYYIPSYQGLGL